MPLQVTDMFDAAEDRYPGDHVVVIDDYQEHLDVLLAYLERAGVPATGFTQPRAGLEHVLAHPPAVVVVNLYMPDMDGIEISRSLHACLPDVPVIGITGSRDKRADAYLRLLSQFGATECLRKPIDGPSFLRAVRSARRQ
jgi:CheY-like chemotaxis protein